MKNALVQFARMEEITRHIWVETHMLLRKINHIMICWSRICDIKFSIVTLIIQLAGYNQRVLCSQTAVHCTRDWTIMQYNIDYKRRTSYYLLIIYHVFCLY